MCVYCEAAGGKEIIPSLMPALPVFPIKVAEAIRTVDVLEQLVGPAIAARGTKWFPITDRNGPDWSHDDGQRVLTYDRVTADAGNTGRCFRAEKPDCVTVRRCRGKLRSERPCRRFARRHFAELPSALCRRYPYTERPRISLFLLIRFPHGFCATGYNKPFFRYIRVKRGRCRGIPRERRTERVCPH